MCSPRTTGAYPLCWLEDNAERCRKESGSDALTGGRWQPTTSLSARLDHPRPAAASLSRQPPDSLCHRPSIPSRPRKNNKLVILTGGHDAHRTTGSRNNFRMPIRKHPRSSCGCVAGTEDASLYARRPTPAGAGRRHVPLIPTLVLGSNLSNQIEPCLPRLYSYSYSNY